MRLIKIAGDVGNTRQVAPLVFPGLLLEGIPETDNFSEIGGGFPNMLLKMFDKRFLSDPTFLRNFGDGQFSVVWKQHVIDCLI